MATRELAIYPIISTVQRNLWDRGFLEDMGVVIITDDRAFFDKLQVHEKAGLAS